MKKDYYAILDLKRDCKSQDIKKQYYNLALRWHPDKHHDKFEAEAKFNEIREAYSVLMNPQEKKFYDRYGHRKSQSSFGGDDSFGQDPFSHLSQAFRQWDESTIDLLWDIISDEPEEKRSRKNQGSFFNNAESSKVFNNLKRTLSNLLEESLDENPSGFFEEFIPNFEEFDFPAPFQKPEQQQQQRQNIQMKLNEKQQQQQPSNPRSGFASPNNMFSNFNPQAGNSKESAIFIEDEEPDVMIIEEEEEDSHGNFFQDLSSRLQGFQSCLDDFHQNLEGHFINGPIMSANFQFYFQNQSV